MNTKKAIVDISNGQLFIDGVLQSDIRDEYIYHEALVHPAMSHALKREDILILGGAEGCTAREVLKWKDVKSVTQVDWDGELCDIFITKPLWNNDSYWDRRMTLLEGDAWIFTENCNRLFDVIIIDLLDPQNKDIERFHQLLNNCRLLLKEGGALTINTGGVFPYDCKVHNEFRKILVGSTPYKVFVPSFEWEWSFILLGESKFPDFPAEIKAKTKMFDLDVAWPQMKLWTRDFKKN